MLLHGWGGSFSATWERHGWCEALAAAGLEVFAVDLPGHGGPASADPADYGDLAGALAERLPRGRVDVVGFSLGGKLALALAMRDRSRFGRMVIGGVGDNLFAPEPSAAALVEALENGVHSTTPAAVAGLVRYAEPSGSDPRALAAVLRRPPNPVIATAALAHVNDILLINGETDRIAMPDSRLRAALRDPAYRSLAGVDHLALLTAPAFRSAAIAFVSRKDAAPFGAARQEFA